MTHFTDQLHEITFPDGCSSLAILDVQQATLARSACSWESFAFVIAGYNTGTEPEYDEVDIDGRLPGAFDDLMTKIRFHQASSSIVSPSLHWLSLPGPGENVETRILFLDLGHYCEDETVEDRFQHAIKDARYNQKNLASLSDADVVLYHREVLSHRLMSIFNLEVVQVITIPLGGA